MLTRSDLWSLEEYSERRPEYRAQVIAHKKPRELVLNPHMRMLFEDRTTIQYQIQEMLRIEKVFDAQGIQDELDAYNPLIPDGNNWKATLMIEYEDINERKQALAQLIGVEDKIWMQVEGHEKAYAIADEDMDRESDSKTSSVHFLRFQLDTAMVDAALAGAAIFTGCDHESMQINGFQLADATANSLRGDLLKAN